MNHKILHSSEARERLLTNFAARVKKLDIQPSALADRAGVHRMKVYRMLNREFVTGPEMLFPLCQVLGLSMDKLFLPPDEFAAKYAQEKS